MSGWEDREGSAVGGMGGRAGGSKSGLRRGETGNSIDLPGGVGSPYKFGEGGPRCLSAVSDEGISNPAAPLSAAVTSGSAVEEWCKVSG